MTAPFVYRLRSALLCVDRETRTLVSLESGSVVSYASAEDQGMVALRRAGREILAFAVDFDDRAEAVQAANG
jgi:hypothetical protein